MVVVSCGLDVKNINRKKRRKNELYNPEVLVRVTRWRVWGEGVKIGTPINNIYKQPHPCLSLSVDIHTYIYIYIEERHSSLVRAGYRVALRVVVGRGGGGNRALQRLYTRRKCQTVDGSDRPFFFQFRSSGRGDVRGRYRRWTTTTTMTTLYVFFNN